MCDFDKKNLKEQEIRTRYITPAIKKSGWNIMTQVREEYAITAGRIVARTAVVKRETPLFADYVLFYKTNKPIAVIEVKDNKHTIGDGMQQALKYAEMMDIPFAFSTNGDKFLFHNKYITEGDCETKIEMDDFPSPELLWEMYKEKNNIAPQQEKVINQSYYIDNPNKQPRYYQLNAINRVTEAIANGQNRILLVMATGTGKTYTAFQIIWRLWKAGIKKRILFLTDRTKLVSQTFTNDFAPFGEHMIWVKKNNFDTAHEIYLGLFQGLTRDNNDENNLYKQFSPGFFDLIIVDECHRGSADDASEWKKVLDYFSSATIIGMTATPKETPRVSSIANFGQPVYVYTLKQGIEDGFLAPYRVIRVFLDKDIEGFIPYDGQTDDSGNLLEKRTYNINDYDKEIVLTQRAKLVAKVVSDYLKEHNERFAKSIFFCVDQEHADNLRTELQNQNADLCSEDSRYVMRITSDDDTGVEELDSFTDVNSKYPTLVTTSKLLTTGVDIKTVKYIILDANIKSMIEFKQIIGRGTRIDEEHEKMYFTIFDFRNVTKLFYDEDFDGPIEQDEDYNPSSKEKPEKPPRVEKKPPKAKHYVGDVEVKIEHEQIQYLNINGQLMTESYIGYCRRMINDNYKKIESFVDSWNKAERKEVIVRELEEKGVFFDELEEQINKQLDPFDLILHIAFDRKPLTRKERAEGVRKSTYFDKYSDIAKEVLEKILDKYCENGVLDIEDANILKVSPISKYGTPTQIVQSIFGGAQVYKEAIQSLVKEIYAIAA